VKVALRDTAARDQRSKLAEGIPAMADVSGEGAGGPAVHQERHIESLRIGQTPADPDVGLTRPLSRFRSEPCEPGDLLLYTILTYW